ncbi:Inner membrane ABC transporter permease protein YcjP [Paenibacillus konkukensis]|uniref:Inner membrane ABC transporter permease protein YcjP n=1 Tax=Paenibacillus konkukensis TaxID=2020716 RepID=A0ABY4RIA7_9BACL|nr:carbohydrate ABC transporter permease [Paenibacillus konkukensis]UQZ82194.1 Inner membrane ABC transporter permease protein YcjP [Paenibacillus konkukensis]
MRESLGDRAFNAVNMLVLVVVSVVTLFPLYYVFVVSFTEPGEFADKNGFVLLPGRWSVSAYEYLLSTSAFIKATGVSAFLATVGTLCSLIITSAFSFGLSRKRLHGRKTMLFMVMFTILFNPGIIPLYLLVRDLGLINSIWSLIVPVLTSGWYVILMKSFFDSIPAELEEAAMIDGCNELSIFVRIILPLSAASLAAFGLFYAVAYWNTFFSAVLYINDFTKVPLQIVLRNMLIDSDTAVGGASAVEMASDKQLPTQTIKMAAVVVSTLPILAVYPFLQKHFTKGVMLGSVKG